MLLMKANSDRVAVIVRADSIDCPELHSSTGAIDSQCWIALKAGQAISVSVELDLNTSQYQVDLVVDGVVRAIKTTTVTPKNGERHGLFEFFQGISFLDRSLYRSPMLVSMLESNKERLQNGQKVIQYQESDNTSVGTIEILVYKYNEGFNHLRAAASPEDVKDWEGLDYAPGTAGVQPTHEVVFDYDNGIKLNDTQRRSWRKKEGRPPMGRVPFAHFKYLYRHEKVLREADIINPHLNVLPTTDAVSATAAGLKKLSSGGNLGSVSPRVDNPYRVSELDGIRIYTLLPLYPDKPGPQPNIALQYHKGKKRARRYTIVDESDSDSEDEYTPANSSSPIYGGAKRLQTKQKDVDDLRVKVARKKVELEKAKLVEETEKGNMERMQMTLEEEFEELATLEASLEHQLEQTNTRVKLYKKTQSDLEARLASWAEGKDTAQDGDTVAVQNNHGHPNKETGVLATANDEADAMDVDDSPANTPAEAHAYNDPANAVKAWTSSTLATPNLEMSLKQRIAADNEVI